MAILPGNRSKEGIAQSTTRPATQVAMGARRDRPCAASARDAEPARYRPIVRTASASSISAAAVTSAPAPGPWISSGRSR